MYGVEIVAFATSVGNIKLFGDTVAMSADPAFLSLADTITRDKVDEFLPVRCPDAEASKRMEARVAELRDQYDSTGGTVMCIIRNAPSGLGEPAFDKLEALIGHAMLSIPAVKGFEIGSGFLGAGMNGSRHNDPFVPAPVLDAAAHKTGIPRSRLHTPRPTTPATCRAAFPTACPSSSASPSRPPRPSAKTKPRPCTTPRARVSCRQRAATTPAWCPARCLWRAWRRWLLLMPSWLSTRDRWASRWPSTSDARDHWIRIYICEKKKKSLKVYGRICDLV
ncbi:bifunctional chorismate synthase/riboflavin reductase [NAD(P)H] aro2 [Metarhizium acridum]|uniref:bifunctional chorismate synthase/riboflavin reductase [NAD(P)H] aro2 n=1 Tax=Metarhizium acridum TaxID=92637 RepID=UPI001C6BE81D|nr:bifunctional chorismate synthase/riboflavin reductase [NAD(P)H] aro2 [Metarhizium acridum]